MGAEIGDLGGEGAHASDSPAMILTCPECATRYFVEDGRVAAEGRAVRCAACGARWTAHPEPSEEPLELAIEPSGDLSAAEPAAAAAEPTPNPRDLPADELPKVFRGRAQTRAKVREAAATGVVWAGLGGVLVLLLVAAVVLRQNIAQLWPRTAGAYAMAGLPVNLVGLAIEDQHAQPALKDGRAVLVVSGALRNIRDQAVAPPPLRVSLLNPAGRPVAVEIADPGGARIPPGEARRFVVNVLDPPVSASDVQIDFVLNGPRRKPIAQTSAAAATATAAQTPALRGATGADSIVAPGTAQPAQPLPQTSPYALQPAPSGPTDAPAPHG
jgi:predicted Zn finger-like uncharacterized protein